jgi:hypothetical protein
MPCSAKVAATREAGSPTAGLGPPDGGELTLAVGVDALADGRADGEPVAGADVVMLGKGVVVETLGAGADVATLGPALGATDAPPEQAAARMGSTARHARTRRYDRRVDTSQVLTVAGTSLPRLLDQLLTLNPG